MGYFDFIQKFFRERQRDKMKNEENCCQKQLALFGQTVIQTEGVECIKDRIIRIVSHLGDYGLEKVDLWHRRFYFVW